MLWTIRIVSVLLPVLLSYPTVRGGIQEKRLLTEKLNVYNPLERPVQNESEAVQLHIQLSLQQIVDLDEKNQILTSNIWLNLDWSDNAMIWDPAEYNNLQEVRIPPWKMWKPDIMLYNSANEAFDATYPTNMIVTSEGKISQIPPGIFKSTCIVDITWFPFDEQTCILTFGTWAHHRARIDLMLSGNPEEGFVDLSQYQENGEWLLVAAPSNRTIIKYSCCPEEYTEVYFHLTIQRRTIYYFHNLIFPCVLIASMAVFGFTTPPDCGEKLTLGITILMSLTFYMNMVSEMQPPSSETPILGVYFSCIMATVASSVVCTIAILNFRYREADSHGMSKFIRVIFLKWLPWLLRMERPGTSHLPLKHMLLKNKIKQLEKADKCPMSLVPGVLDREEEFVAGSLANTNFPLQNENLLSSLSDFRDTSSLSLQSMMDNQKPKMHVKPKERKPVSVVEKDLLNILKEMKSLSRKMKEDDESKNFNSEWKYAAMVLDRVCLVVFTSTTLLVSIAVLVAVPRIFVF